MDGENWMKSVFSRQKKGKKVSSNTQLIYYFSRHLKINEKAWLLDTA